MTNLRDAESVKASLSDDHYTAVKPFGQEILLGLIPQIGDSHLLLAEIMRAADRMRKSLIRLSAMS